MQTKPLYERLDGYDAIAAITDELLARLRNDPQCDVFCKSDSEGSLRKDRHRLVGLQY
jgi:truncated hemoglobin YjbI